MLKRAFIDWRGFHLVFLNDFAFSIRYSFISFIGFCFIAGYSYSYIGVLAGFPLAYENWVIGLMFAGSIALTVAIHELGHGLAYLASNIQWNSISFGFISRVTGNWHNGIKPSKIVRIFVTLAGPLLPSIVALFVFSLFGSLTVNFYSIILAVAIFDGIGNLLPIGPSDGGTILNILFERKEKALELKEKDAVNG